MIQTVGIKFQAEGLETVTAQMRTLATSVKALVTGIKNLETLDSTAAINNLNRLALGMGNAASKLSLAANEINAAVTAFTGANAALGRGRPASVTSSTQSTSTSNTKEPWYMPSAILGTTGNLAKYTAAFGLVYGAKEAGRLALGGGREDMIEPNLRLAGTGIVDKKWHRDIEKSNYEFVKKHPAVSSIADLQTGASRLSSIHPFGEKDAKALTASVQARLTQQLALYGKLTEQSAEKAGETIGFIVNAKLGRMSPEERKQYDTKPGMLESLYHRQMGLMQKAIDISGLSSQQIFEFNKHAQTATAMAGWTDAQALSLVSLMHDTGNKASSSGRAIKNLQANTAKLGMLSLLGSDDIATSDRAKKLKPGDLKQEGYLEYKRLEKLYQGDPFGLLEYIGKVRKQAETRDIDTSKYISTDFRGQVLQATDPNAIAELRRREKLIEPGISMQEIEGRVGQVETQENTRLKRLSQKMDILKKRVGDTSMDTISPLGGIDAVANLAIDGLTLFATALVSPTTALNEFAGHIRGLAKELSQIPGAIKSWWNKSPQKESSADKPYLSQLGEEKPTAIYTGKPIAYKDETSTLRPMTSEERNMTHSVSGAATVRVEVDLKNPPQQPVSRDVEVPLQSNTSNSTGRRGVELLGDMF